jgi:hypothetical protein
MTSCDKPHPMDHSNGVWWCGATEPPTRARRLGDGKVRVDILKPQVHCEVPLPAPDETHAQEILYPFHHDTNHESLDPVAVGLYAAEAFRRNQHIVAER